MNDLLFKSVLERCAKAKVFFKFTPLNYEILVKYDISLSRLRGVIPRGAGGSMAPIDFDRSIM